MECMSFVLLSLSQYLTSVRPLMNDEDYKVREQEVEKFKVHIHNVHVHV